MCATHRFQAPIDAHKNGALGKEQRPDLYRSKKIGSTLRDDVTGRRLSGAERIALRRLLH